MVGLLVGQVFGAVRMVFGEGKGGDDNAVITVRYGVTIRSRIG